MKLSNTDPIADFLTRIRNSLMLGRADLNVPHSKSNELIAGLLKTHGYINDYQVIGNGLKQLQLSLFKDGTTSPITALERVSKPGRRVYVKASEIPLVMGGQGLTIISTSRGLLDGKTARRNGIGGELICKVY